MGKLYSLKLLMSVSLVAWILFLAAKCEARDTCESVYVFNSSDSDAFHTITSPNYPEDYPPNTNHCWELIAVDNGPRLLIQELYVDIELDRDCNDDYMTIIDGIEERKYCGESAFGAFVSSGNRVKIQFVSDGDTHAGKGFQIQVQTTNFYQSDDCIGVDVESERTVTLKSPGYPRQDYPRNVDICWNVYSTSYIEPRLELDVVRLDLEENRGCSYDWLKLWDSDDLIGKYCDEDHVDDFISSTGMVKLKFHSDSRTEDDGFKIKIEATDDYPDEDDDLTFAEIVGIIIGVVFAVTIILVFGFFIADAVATRRSSRARTNPAARTTQGHINSADIQPGSVVIPPTAMSLDQAMLPPKYSDCVAHDNGVYETVGDVNDNDRDKWESPPPPYIP